MSDEKSGRVKAELVVTSGIASLNDLGRWPIRKVDKAQLEAMYMSDEKPHDPLCRVNRGGHTCNCSLSFGGDKPSPGPWWWNDDRTVLSATNPEHGKGYPPQRHFLVLAVAEDYGGRPDPADAALIADAPAMLELLRRVATRIPDVEGTMVDRCAICGHDPEWPKNEPTHRPGCELAALLDKHGRG